MHTKDRNKYLMVGVSIHVGICGLWYTCQYSQVGLPRPNRINIKNIDWRLHTKLLCSWYFGNILCSPYWFMLHTELLIYIAWVTSILLLNTLAISIMFTVLLTCSVILFLLKTKPDRQTSRLSREKIGSGCCCVALFCAEDRRKW
jgi:hypothetical protein